MSSSRNFASTCSHFGFASSRCLNRGTSGYPSCRYLEAGARTVTPPDPSTFLKDDPCPRCGKPQVMRHGRYGDFKSCSYYPNCKPERSPRTAAASMSPRPSRRTQKPPLPAA